MTRPFHAMIRQAVSSRLPRKGDEGSPAGAAPLGRAFTLIELLTAVAVMGLLISMLLPAVGHAVEEARKVKCLGNLRQMAIAANAYCNNNGGSYPIAQYWDNSDSKVRVKVEWDFITHIDRATCKVVAVKPGLLWQSCDPDAVQQCPSYRGPSNSLADPFTGYNYNVSYIGHGQGETRVAPANQAEVQDPCGCALFGDGQYAAGANKFMRSPFPHLQDKFKSRAAGTLGFRHNGAANVVFCDGHARPFTRACRQTTSSEKPKIAANCGFLSEDNGLYDLE